MTRFDPRNVSEYTADSKDIETFQRDGVVILRGVFSEWVEPLRIGLDRNLADPKHTVIRAKTYRRERHGIRIYRITASTGIKLLYM